MATIGIVGLGHMGLPMMKNLIKAGHTVYAYDINPEAMQHAVDNGANQADSVAHLAQQSDMALTMLQTGEQVESVCIGTDGIFAHLTSGSLFMDCSTIDALHSNQLHQHAKQANLMMVDAPVSGGVVAAEQAHLTFMVGGEQVAFDQAQPILELMGKRIVHTGDATTGVAAKICNNMVLATSMIAVCEAFILGQKMGLSAQRLFEVMKDATGQCWSLTSYCPEPNILPNVPSSNNYQAGFTAGMMLKDLTLADEAATQVSSSTPLGQHARQLYDEFVASKGPELDFSAMMIFLKEMSDNT